MLEALITDFKEPYARAKFVTHRTLNTASFLALRAELGKLESGKISNIVIIYGDPLADIRELCNVELVIRGGRVFVDKR